MAIKIQTTRDISVEGIKCVVYGESGVGKTVLCATAPDPLILSAEKGLLSLSNMDVPFLPVTNIAEIGEVYKFLIGSEEAKQYKTICIDSLSELTEVCLLEIKDKMIKESGAGKIDARQAYGKLAESVGRMIRRLRDLVNFDVVFVAKMKRIEDDDGSLINYEPYLPGRVLPFNLPYLVDELFCMRMDRKNERYLQTSDERRYPAKDRSGTLKSEEYPNLTAIFNKIRSKK